MNFTRYPGAYLQSPSRSKTQVVRGLLRCSSLCVDQDGCVSLNYQFSTKECTMIGVESLYGDDNCPDLTPAADFIHLRSRRCAP